MKNVIIIGAGAAGLMAAQKLAEQGMKVHVYDRMKSPARKFLLAGRGGLNLTHNEPIESFLTRYTDSAPHIKPMLDAFSPQDVRDWADGLGVETFVGTSGRVFPKSLKASPLLRAWLKGLQELGVEFHFQHEFTGFDGTIFHFGDRQITADFAILAMGGASWAKLGSDGGFAKLLAKKGIEISPLKPANMGFNVAWSDYMAPHFGKPLKGCIFSSGGIAIKGEAMLTEKGIEGGAIYSLSKVLREKIDETGEAVLAIDFKPELKGFDLKSRLGGKASTSTKLRKLNLSPQEIALIQEVKGDLDLKVKGLQLVLKAYGEIDKAISTAGGVKFSELNQELSLKKFPHIFVAGEMLDFEAPTGGYLLQAAFSSGVVAANAINARLSQPVQSPL